MKRKLILCLFLAMTSSAGFCATGLFPPLQPLQPIGKSNVTSLADPYVKDTYAQENVNYPKINQIEQALYGKIYTKQDVLLRVSRLEKSIFSATYPNLGLSQRVDNILANFNQMNQLPNISKNTLSKLESKVFKRNFAHEDVETRVEQLEQQVFGATQSGDLTPRVAALKAAVPSYKANQDELSDFQDPFRAQPRGLRGIAGAFGNMFSGGSGCMTGFTPPIDPYSTNFANGYSNTSGYNNPFGGGFYGNNTLSSNNLYGNGYNNRNYGNLGGLNGGNGYNNYGSFADMSSPNGYSQSSGTRSNRGYRYQDGVQNYGSQTGVTILD